MLRELKSSTAERCYTMMDNLRTAANSVVLKIIFGIIIVSFILTGLSGYLIGGG
ncbi:SurA N-terminal domain-containing protein, partial [Staphylococcus aureus]|uniref:SurA N-terminal domain-containing protein n=1 Tax=Staphylococcus aureus TaxID=1280 RepID=UPI001C55719B